jgi:hypothetical protein
MHVVHVDGVRPWWNDTDRRKSKNSVGVPVPLYPPQIPHGLTRARTRTLCSRVLLEQLIVANSPNQEVPRLYEEECSLPCSQEPVTGNSAK